MGANLKAMMKKRNMSATEIAYKAGVSERYVFFIMQGVRSPSLKVAMKMARALKCKVEDIFMSEKCTNRT